MALSPDERKGKLGTGGLAKIARRLRLTKGHVSQVNQTIRRDLRVERAIARDILKRHPELDPTTIWPPRDARDAATPREARRTETAEDTPSLLDRAS